MRRLYGASIRYMDDWLARICEALDERGALDDTIVMVTSDHGENFGEAGLLAHCFSLDDRLIHVPLIVRGPREAVDLDRVVSLAELPRLVAEMAGIEDHPWTEALPEGIALSQLDPPVLATDPRAREVADDWSLNEEGFNGLTTAFESATDGRRKLIRRRGRQLLHDLVEDPLEVSPRDVDVDPPSGTEAEAVDRLRDALDHPAMTATGLEPATVPAASGPPGTTPEETEDLEERMRLLGYL
jgi:arylsulfatase A-like enzyme